MPPAVADCVHQGAAAVLREQQQRHFWWMVFSTRGSLVLGLVTTSSSSRSSQVGVGRSSSSKLHRWQGRSSTRVCAAGDTWVAALPVFGHWKAVDLGEAELLLCSD